MIAVSRTDVGKLRANNQDALVAMEQLWGVADGMGGHKGGEIASAGARDGLTRILRGKDPDPKMLRFAVEAVNRRLYLQQKDDASLSGMGSRLFPEGARRSLAVCGGGSRHYEHALREAGR